ncbi:MAG TPA: hypothetical protein VGR02_04045 [Thermoanaerobaculia bacterium]|jgi:hypothetical protein|nr:hypothetical protein [Thermoanaerobaculia bacterium]
MKSRKQKATDEQIEAEMLAKRGDPSAWKALPFVPASASPRPAWMLRSKHLELAAKFHVLSVLHRLDIEANLALGQPDNVDIAILGKAGLAITIDVKTIEGSREWLVEPFSVRKHHYVVVVEFPPQKDTVVAQPRAYIVASETLRKLVVRKKLKAIPLDFLSDELAALEAWQLISAEQAA